ncbi:HCP-like protein [Backusella circina FSU 941]|nr:HCP-like protein [Backusella circina FSU 941]
MFNSQLCKTYYDHPLAQDNLINAFKWIMLAAQQQNSEAQFKLGDLYAFGQGVEKDESTAYGWYLKSALQGYPKALIRIHNLYHTETGMALDRSHPGLSSSIHLQLKKGVLMPISVLDLIITTTIIRNGTTVELSSGIWSLLKMETAAPRYNKAKLNEARRVVAQIYKDGDCIDQNYHKVSIWYKKAAKTGDNQARYELGLMYHHGLGVRKDPLEASKWYTFAANKNNNDARCQLGILRECGEGLIQDTLEVIRLYNEAAKQKNPHALFKLVQVYEGGSGVEKNFELAFKLFGITSRLGSLDAQLKLA